MNYREEADGMTTDQIRGELQDLTLFRTSFWYDVVESLCTRLDDIASSPHGTLHCDLVRIAEGRYDNGNVQA